MLCGAVRCSGSWNSASRQHGRRNGASLIFSPITKIEFQPILQYELQGVTGNDLQPYALDHAIRLVFIDGMFSMELSEIQSHPTGIEAGSLAEAMRKHPEQFKCISIYGDGRRECFHDAQYSFFVGWCLYFGSKGSYSRKSDSTSFCRNDRDHVYAAQPRNIIIAGIDSQCKIVETYVGLAQNTYLTNTVTEITLGDNSVVEHDKFQVEGVNAYHIGTTHVQMNAASRFTSNVISLGGSIVRNNLDCTFRC
jgi:Fe-S cluster assembly protein SufD